MILLLGTLVGAALDPIIWIVSALTALFVSRYQWLVIGAMCAGLAVSALSAALYEATAYPGAAVGTERLLALIAAHQILAHGIAHAVWGLRRLSRR